ncbi:f-box/fbd/lrr-repeat protein [Quercus suber]|uniref:F-box/fbd/lrr-repeat protein n=1 Tax=Quercus suber TaxID=58331 RepID=A0AAW0K0N0_QUESU
MEYEFEVEEGVCMEYVEIVSELFENLRQVKKLTVGKWCRMKNQAMIIEASAANIDEEDEDRISTLPDSIILIILSSLLAKEAIITGVLSQRWAYLWTSVPSLRFTDTSFENADVLALPWMSRCSYTGLQNSQTSLSYSFTSDT